MGYGAQLVLVIGIAVALALSAHVSATRLLQASGLRRLARTSVGVVTVLGMYACWPMPEVPVWEEPATEQERKARDFAHSVVLPESVPKPVPFNFAWARLKALVPGVPNVSEQYFTHLCDTEAGQFIFKTVDNVDGFLQMRPRRRYTEIEMMDPYLVESAVGLSGDSGQFYEQPLPNVRYGGPIYFVQPMIGHYLWLDQPAIDRKAYIHYFRNQYALNSPSGKKDFVTGLNGRSIRVPFLIDKLEKAESEALVGYTYRGIRRASDRVMRIAGGELIVINRQSGEVLAVYREFKFASGKLLRWNLSRWCGNSKSFDDHHLFISKVLIPRPDVNRDIPLLQ